MLILTASLSMFKDIIRILSRNQGDGNAKVPDFIILMRVINKSRWERWEPI